MFLCLYLRRLWSLQWRIIFLLLYTLQLVASKQCLFQNVSLYRNEPVARYVDWSVQSDLCFSHQECHGRPGDVNFLPQLCPLELQPGDNLILLPPTNDFQAVYAANVSEASFLGCSFQNISEDQKLTASPVSSPVQVPSNFLPAGQVAFFVQLPSSVFATCEFGLRLRVLVKSVDCRRSARSELCWGRGDCVSRWLEDGYRCECTGNYTGQYCEEYDGCSIQPCSNGGTCVDLQLGDVDEGFLCVCPEHLTGLTCQEIEGSCDANHKCVNGFCRNSSSNSHTCSCHEGFSGVFCSVDIDECSSSPCLSGATCVDRIAGYECVCEEHYAGVHCGEEKNYCDQVPCLNDGVCSPYFGGYNCTCATGFTGQNCSVNIDECVSVPCQNNGTCEDQVNMFRCFCPSGYSGLFCDEDIDECSSSPCHNNGTCRDRVNGFTCECMQGWTGPLCDVDILECSSDPCLNNGECHEGNNGYACNCLTDLFDGPHCEIPLHNCSFYPCQHNGTCNIVDDLTYSCLCPERYEGANCEVYVPFCRENSCSFDSLCIEGESGYSCECSLGFQGRFCEINIDDCANVFCTNGASCMDGINEFLCICPSGFDGRYCEIDVNECASRPCTNGGTCLDLVDGYLCLCLAGYEGGVCEVDIDECASMPCVNGGSCIDGVNEFTCECGTGYNGTDCSLDLDLCSMDVCQNNSSCSEVDGGHNYSCICGPGFTGRSCEVDIDECSSSPCQNDAICRDAPDAYQCYCLPGYVGDNCEFEINECFSSPCLHNSTCIDLYNNYSCVCQEGYEGFNCEVDIDECASHRCLRNATCVDEVNGYSCVCPRGYAGDRCEEEFDECSSQPCNADTSMCVDLLDGYQCFCLSGWAGPTCTVNIDECLSQPCFNGATCMDGISEYSCQCVDGYGGSNCEVEIDECISEPCLHATSCIDTLAGYDCICVAGYEGANCEININECASHPCNHNGTCFDLVNGFTCDCLPTYYGDDCSLLPCEVFQCENDGICRDARDDLGNHPLGFRCDCLSGFYGSRCDMNIDECPENACSGNGFCLDGVNTYTCLCGPGWDGLDCNQPIDDCVDNLCQNNSTCMDLSESYECLCPDGIEGDLCERETNECSGDPCENEAQCVDLFNDYRCNCLPGWTGKNCSLDLDECSSNPCSNNATCVNQEGLFSCVCPPFYTGGLCEVTFDPCNIIVNPCENNATCVTEVNGTALCSCQEGYGGLRCEVNVNECASSPCLNGALCEDVVAGFLCHCLAGFSGILCEENIDDCFEDACLNGGTCLDQVNSYTCECSRGWSSPNCTDDINECMSRPCQNGATCIDLRDSYQCICPLGYQGNDCEVDVDECLSQPCRNNGTCFDIVANVTCVCPDGFTGALCEDNIDDCDPFPCNNGSCNDEIAGFTCSCYHGYTGSTCLEDVNECSSQPCLNGATCVDLVDSYRCVCNHGYRGVNCEFDIDVCNDTALNRSQCLNGGSCVDGPGGSFHCVCADGYSGEYCQVEIDECRSSPCLNGATCSDQVNGVTCSCLEGWSGEFCDVDLDECLSDPCQNGGICSMLSPPGGFLCFCPPGYQGVLCEVDYDECLSNPCLYGATCVDDVNIFRCLCPVGYSGAVCGDEIDICDIGPCRNNGTCTFLGPGKYNCSCMDGFVGTDCGTEDPCVSSPCGNGSTCQLSQESFICLCPPGYHGDRCQSILSTLSSASSTHMSTTRMPRSETMPALFSTSISSVGFKTDPMTFETSTSFVTKTESSFPSVEYSSSKTMQFTSSRTSSRTDLAFSSTSGAPVIYSSSSFPTEAKGTSGGVSLGPQSPETMVTTFDTTETEFHTAAVSSYSKSSISTPFKQSSAIVTEQTGVTQSPENIYTTMTALTDEGRSDIITTLSSGSSEELSVSSSIEQFSTYTNTATTVPTSNGPNTELKTEEQTQIRTAQNTDDVTPTIESLSTSTEGKIQTAVSSYQTFGVSKTYATDTNSFGTNVAESTEGMSSTRRATDDAQRTTEATSDLYTTVVARETTLASQKLSTQIIESTTVARSTLVTSPISNGVSTFAADSTTVPISHSPGSSSAVSTDVESTVTPGSTSSSTGIVSEMMVTGRRDGSTSTQELLTSLKPVSPSSEVPSFLSTFLSTFATTPVITSTSTSTEMPLTTPPLSLSTEMSTNTPHFTSPLGVTASSQQGVTMTEHVSSTFSDSTSPTGGVSHPSTFEATSEVAKSSTSHSESQSTSGTSLTNPSSKTASPTEVSEPPNKNGTVPSTSVELSTTSQTRGNVATTEARTEQRSFPSPMIAQTPSTESPIESSSTTLRVSISQPDQTSTEVDLTSLTSTENILTPSSRMESSSIIPTSDVMTSAVSKLPLTTSLTSVTTPDISTTLPKVFSTLTHVVESSIEIQSTTSANLKSSTAISITSMQDSKTSSTPEPVSTSTSPATCQSLVCQNGGTCRESQMSGAVMYTCDCPFRFGGSFCEQELTIFFPSFDGDGYLEHVHLGLAGYAYSEVFVSFISRSGSGLLLFSESIPTSSSDDYLYLYLHDWRVSAEISCGFGQILRVHSDVAVDSGEHVSVLLRQTRPAGTEFVCKLQIEVKGQMSSIETISFIYPQPLGPLYVGGLPQDFSPHTSAPVASGLVGCVRYLQVNSVEYNVYEDAVDGRDIRSCMVDEKCQYKPCKNNGTCVSLTTGSLFLCLCEEGYSGLLCEHQIHFCWPNPCHAGATCVPLEEQESFICLCPYGRFGLTCNETLAVSRPLFSGTVLGYASHLQYARVLNWDFVLALRLKFALANGDSAVRSNWLLYSGQKGQGYRGSDYIALGIQDSFLRLQFDLGTGAAILRSPQPLNLSLPYHSLQVGRHQQVGWLQVDNQVNVSATTQGHLIGLNTYRDLFIGGLSPEEGAFLPDNLSFQNGFQGCIYDVEVRAGRYGEFSTVGEPPGHVDSAVNIGQCSLSECALSECKNGATCVDVGASYRCECTSGWKGPLCEDKINACSPEHDPPPLCSEGSLCVLQAVGYACLCPLGKTGRFCTFEHGISDPLFRGDWSFMSFAVTSDVRFETIIKLEFKATGHSGLLFYAAQSLRQDAGDFISVALANGYVEFRFSLDGQSDPGIVKTSIPLSFASDTWHSIEVSRFNQLGILRADGEVLRISAPGNLISLDVGTDFFVGGAPDLSSVNPLAVENEVLGFEGCIRRVSVNGFDLDMTVDGAKDGRNIGDCDGTGCGSAVCKNNGTCIVQGLDMQDFTCLCQPPFEGETCSDVAYCSGHLCGNNGTCVPQFQSRNYTCVCSLGWTGPYCNQSVMFSTGILLTSQSSLLFVDGEYNISSDLTETNLSISFKTFSENGLLLWVGSPEIGRTRDYLAVGVDEGRVKVGIHLGHDSSTIINHVTEINDGMWHSVTVLRFSTFVSVYVDEELPVTLDVGGSYSSLDTEGHYHFGGFRTNRDVSTSTGRLFDSPIEGCVRNVKYGNRGTLVDFSKARYGYQIDACV